MKRPPAALAGAMVLVIIATAFAGVVGVVAPAQARFADPGTGSGLYPGYIDWFEWGVDGEQIPPSGITKTNTRVIGTHTLETTCTLSNISGAINAYRPGNYTGDALDDLYNIGGTGTSNQLINGIANTNDAATVSFNFGCSATFDGNPLQLQGLVYADAESSENTQGEFIEATPFQPVTWRIIDRLRGPGCTTSTEAILNGSTLRLANDGPQCANANGTYGPMAVAFMEGATSAAVTMKGGGFSAVALGVILSTDFGDAPASYGEAGSGVAPTWTGGVVNQGVTNVTSDSFTLGTPGAPVPVLGASVDADGAYLASPDALGDDNTGDAATDENGIAPPGVVLTEGGETYDLDVACTGPGFVTGWVDWNNNGVFDVGERAGPVECVGTTTVNLAWTVPGDVVESVSSPTFMRLRIAVDAADSQVADNIAGIGEVEDYVLNVDLPERVLQIDKTVAGFSGPWSFDFTLTPDGGSPVTDTVTDAAPSISFDLERDTTYTLEEIVPAGWDLNLTCSVPDEDGATPGIQFTTPDNAAPLLIECDANNDTSASVSVTKSVTNADPGQSWSFDFDLTPTGGSAATESVDDASPTATWDDLVAGTEYTLTEVPQSDWLLENMECTIGGAPIGDTDFSDGLTFTPGPGESVVCTATNTDVSADIELDKRLGTLPGGGIVGDANGNGLADVGEILEYEFEVTNTGKSELTSVGVTDPKIGTVTCVVTTLAPGASTICVATYTVTQADVDAGSVDNTATASGIPPATAADPDPAPVTDDDSNSFPANALAEIEIVKSAVLNDGDGDSLADVGETITYEFDVTNTGTVTLDPVAVNDPKVGTVTCPTDVLAPGDSMICTATDYTVTQADVDAGSVDNTATATGTPPTGPDVTDTDSETVDVDDLAEISIVKTATPSTTPVSVGDTIDYTFEVTNTGNVTLDPVVVSDPKVGTVTCSPNALAPGESVTCTAATYVVNLADVNAGSVDNTATATGTPPTGPDATDDDSTSTPADALPAIEIVKSATLNDLDGDVLADAGETITYEFEVTNTGTVTLDPVSVNDPKVGTVTCSPDVLDPGDSVTCTAADYTVTQADVDAASVDNTATATGTPPTGPDVTDTDSETVDVDDVASIAIVKTATPSATPVGVGDTIDFTFEVTNNGNVTLDPVVVSDPKVGTVTCSPNVLAPGDSVTCTAATYSVTQDDVDAGSVDNTATATGTPPTGPDVNDDDATSTPADVIPGIEIVKSAVLNDGDGDSLADVGETITYEFEVTNTGTVTLDPVSVDDPKVGTVTCSPNVLAPGDSVTCTAGAYTVTQADVDAGAVDNTATATGTPPTGPDVTDTGSETVDVDDLAEISIVKTATPSASPVGVGDTIDFTFEVTNTGNVTLDPVTISDPVAGAVTCTDNVLAPGASTTCAADVTYVVDQGDVDAGSVDNTATATGTPPSGPDVTDDDSTTTPADVVPGIEIVKSATLNDGDGDSLADVGETITYSFEVTNTGTVTLDPVSVDDPKVGAVTCSPNVLAPGDSVTCTATDYTVTQADVDAGSVDNTATATGTPPTGPDVTDTGSETVDVDQTPEIEIVKSATLNDGDGDSLADVGETVTYSFEVTNTGTVTLDPVSVSDPKAGTVTCATDVLLPGASTTCTAADYTVTQADVDSGSVDNTATATGTPPTGPDVTDTDSETVDVDQTPEIEIAKSATLNDGDGDSLADAGETITYSFEVTNTGTVTLDPVSVDDPKVGTVTCSPNVLAPGDSVTCTAADYTVTQADVDSGSVDNTATATGTPPTGPDVTDTGSETVDVDQTPEISIVKTATASASPVGVGDTIDFTFEVTNTGTVTLDPVVVSDPVAGAVTCDDTVLAPGASTTCAADASYVVTQGDVNAGSVDNTATATGTPPTGPDATDDDSTSTPADVIPGIEIAKSATLNDGDGDSLADAGETITYSFEVTNTGTVTLDPVSVSDPKVGTVTCSPDALDPGDSVTCTAADYTVTQADVDSGSVDNTATATGTPPTGPDVTDTGSETVDVDQTPEIEIVKSATLNDGDGDSLADAGETITYEFEVTNTGTVTLDPVSVSDPKVGTVTCPTDVLAPGDSMTCTAADYTVTQADVNAGSVDNTATATGTPPTGPDVTDTGSETVDVDQTPAVEIVKSAALNDGDGDSLADVGETITYEFEVTNTGTVTLDPVSVDDPKVGAVTCSPNVLDPGDSVTCTAADYTVTQADVDAGSVDNTATATGTPPTGPDVTDTDSETVDVDQTPAIEIVKSATLNDGDGDSLADAGETITYSFEVTNTGTVTLDPVSVDDPKVGAVTCSPDFLAPGDSVTCTAADYTVTQADVDSGSVDNTATATGTPPTGPDVTDTDSETVDVDQTPEIEIVKSATLNDGDGDSLADAGETITYEFEVTNTGTVTLDPVSVSDPKVGTVTCSPNVLAPGDSVTCTAADYTVTQADVDSGSVDNTATATGTPPTGPDVTDTGSETVDVDQTPELSIVKSATLNDGDGDGLADVGETITYEFEVTNTGTVTLDPVSVDDPKVGTVTCSPDFLAPGDSVTCTAADYTVTQADVDSGSVDNTATATGTPPTGPDVTDTGSETVDVDQTPAIELVKEGILDDTDGNGYADVGEVIDYTLVATNTGTVTLTDVDVEDSLLETNGLTWSCTPDVSATPTGVTLLPGESINCVGSYEVVQPDADLGFVLNTATATGTPPTGPDVIDRDTVPTPSDVVPDIELVKVATLNDGDGDGLADVGETITYTFEVTNTGTVTLDPVSVSDAMVDPVTCSPTVLAPNESVTCTAADYTVTQADVDAGSIVNSATATGTPPRGPDVTDDDTTTTPADQTPVIEVVKTATLNDGDGDALADVGETITYEFEITNTGTVTLDPVSVDDPKVGAVTCSPDFLAPGDSVTCTAADYTVTQADVDSGAVDNTATATGTPPTGPDVTDEDSTSTPADVTPAIALVKSATLNDGDGDGLADVGETITYSFAVTNTGTVTLDPVSVADAMVGTVTCSPNVLLPGESVTCAAADYTVMQADVDAGSIVNTATATGTPPTGEDVTDNDTTTTPADVVAGLEVSKSAQLNDLDGDSLADVGETITYWFEVTNTGTVTLDPVEVSDPMLGAVTCDPDALAPGESVICTADDYTVTQADVDAGEVANSATATGTPPTGEKVTDGDTTTTPTDSFAGVALEKYASLDDANGNGFGDEGEEVTYTFNVTNTGSVTITDFTIDDPLVGAVECDTYELAPGASASCEAVNPYVITAADAVAGSVVNVATVTAHTGTDNSTTISAEANATVRTGVSDELPATGFDVRRPLVFALLSALLGMIFVAGARRRV